MRGYFKCPICGNDDPKKIGIRNGQKYCRACLSFSGQPAKLIQPISTSAFFHLAYVFSDEQRRVSNEILANYINGIDTLVDAITGAGKTELVFSVIRYVIEHGGLVGFAIPRKDVVIELSQRLREVFKQNAVASIYGGHVNVSYDSYHIICLTTHQLYRYPKSFDLLIVDEIDAFPFHGNKELYSFMKKSLTAKGRLILMSATFSSILKGKKLPPNVRIVSLYSRYHGYPLPVPKVVVKPSLLKYATLIHYLKLYASENKQVFVFTPTIQICELVYKVVSKIISNGNYVHSKHPKRAEIIQKFKEHKFQYLITTAVLERGVTVKNLQVIVFQADHKLYDQASLVQISGRVGRKIDAPTGDVIFLVDKQNEEISGCIEEIKHANRNVQELL